jgi:hypothetical protein
MPHVPDAVLNEMLKQLPKETRKTLANVVSGKITHQVRCESDICKGEVIGYFYPDGVDDNGRPKYRVEPVTVDGKMKLRSVRKRLDGHYGFQCWCGQDSRLAAPEQDSIGYDGQPPTRQGLEDIYARLQKKPAHYPEVNGARDVDGFSIERVA